MTDAHCHVSCGDSSVRELLIGRDFFGIHPWQTLGDPTLSLIDPISTLPDSTVTLPGPISPDPTATLSDPISPDPTATLSDPISTLIDPISQKLLANPSAGVGEIGLDRLKCRDIPPLMREVFERQLALAFDLHRPVVLHGAKCWGQVVETIKNYELRIMNQEGKSSLIHNSSSSIHHSSFIIHHSFLFHGFSRSDGLIPEIVKLNGFISVGPAVLNDHAVNYRELIKKIPLDRILVETDRTEKTIMNDELRIMNNGRKSSSIHNSSFIIHHSIYDVLNKTAEVIGIPAAELEKITDENADRFLGAV